MYLVQIFDQGCWLAQELVHEEDLIALEDNYAKHGYALGNEPVWLSHASTEPSSGNTPLLT